MPRRGTGRFRFVVVNVEQVSVEDLASIGRGVPPTDPIFYCAAPGNGPSLEAGRRLHVVMLDEGTSPHWEAVAQGLDGTHRLVGMVLVSEPDTIDGRPAAEDSRANGAPTSSRPAGSRPGDGRGEVGGCASEVAALRKLTKSERRVLRLLADGLSTKQIATKLYVSPRTVESHRSQISDKLSIHSIAGLTKFAVRTRLTTLS